MRKSLLVLALALAGCGRTITGPVCTPVSAVRVDTLRAPGDTAVLALWVVCP